MDSDGGIFSSSTSVTSWTVRGKLVMGSRTLRLPFSSDGISELLLVNNVLWLSLSRDEMSRSICRGHVGDA